MFEVVENDDKFIELRKELVWCLSPMSLKYVKSHLRKTAFSVAACLLDCRSVTEAEELREKSFGYFKSVDSMCDVLKTEVVDVCDRVFAANDELIGNFYNVFNERHGTLEGTQDTEKAIKDFIESVGVDSTKVSKYEAARIIWEERPVTRAIFQIQDVAYDGILLSLLEYFNTVEPEGYVSAHTLVDLTSSGVRPYDDFICGVMIVQGKFCNVGGLLYTKDDFFEILSEMYDNLMWDTYSFASKGFDIYLFFFLGEDVEKGD